MSFFIPTEIDPEICHTCGERHAAIGCDECAQCLIAYYMNPENNDEPHGGMAQMITELSEEAA